MSPVIAFLATLLLATEALAYGDGTTCDVAALAAAEEYGVPPQIMLAITRVETGRREGGQLLPWPWAVNQAGTPHWFDSPEEAEEFVQAAIDTGLSNIDIGCFQLNLRWHGEKFISVQDMFDPQLNANYAARFLAENHSQKGNWVDAVAAYHSQNPVYAEAYVEKVEEVLISLSASETGFPSPDIADATPDPMPNRENLFPLLQPGGSGTLASLVPSGQAATPLFAAMP